MASNRNHYQTVTMIHRSHREPRSQLGLALVSGHFSLSSCNKASYTTKPRASRMSISDELMALDAIKLRVITSRWRIFRLYVFRNQLSPMNCSSDFPKVATARRKVGQPRGRDGRSTQLITTGTGPGPPGVLDTTRRLLTNLNNCMITVLGT